MPRRKTPEEYDAEIEQLKARKRDAVAREHAAARKAENHAKFVAGGLVLSCFPDGWESVDWDRLARSIRHAAPTFSKMVIPDDERPRSVQEATKNLRAWEAKDRVDRNDSSD